MNSKFLYLLVPMLIAGCDQHAGSGTRPAEKTPSTTPTAAKPTAKVSDESPLEGMFKNLDQVDQQLSGLDRGKVEIEDAAKRIAVADEWLFAPDVEGKARARIDSEVDRLRGRIEKKVTDLSAKAIGAKNGKDALKQMAEINSLLVLYPAPAPAPGNEAQQEKLDQLSDGVLSTSRRVEDIRRLRYNYWAIDQIKASLDDYHKQLKVHNVSDLTKLFSTDRDALIRSSVSWMGPIDPTFLDPAAMDLYNYVYGLTRDAMGNDDVKRIALARGFANPNQKRITPADF